MRKKPFPLFPSTFPTYKKKLVFGLLPSGTVKQKKILNYQFYTQGGGDGGLN